MSPGTAKSFSPAVRVTRVQLVLYARTAAYSVAAAAPSAAYHEYDGGTAFVPWSVCGSGLSISYPHRLDRPRSTFKTVINCMHRKPEEHKNRCKRENADLCMHVVVRVVYSSMFVETS